MKEIHKKAMRDLKKRLLFASLASVFVAALIVLSHLPFMGVVISLIVAALASIAVWEYGNLARAKGHAPSLPLMIALAAASVLALFASSLNPAFAHAPILVLFLGLIAIFISHFKTPKNGLADVALQFFGICYIALPLGLLIVLLMRSAPSYDGRWWLLYLILVTKITDIGGYFVGRLFGKTPLAPVLSPQKTVEGFLAGLISAVVLSILFSLLGTPLSQGGFSLSLFHSIWLGAVLGLVGQVGDLAESLLKRDANVKDSNALPGLGGVLDMVDSLLLTIPVIYFFLTL